MARLSLYSANIYFNDLLRTYRNKFIFNQFILPFLIGNIIIFLIKIPEFSYFDIALNSSMILILLPVLMRSITIEDFYFDEEPRTITFNLILPIATIFLLFFFRFILGFGIRL